MLAAKLYYLFTIICFFLVNIKGTAQEAYTYTFGTNINKGLILKHTNAIGHLTQSYPRGLEIYLNKNTYGQKAWEAIYNYPDVGFSLGYYDLDNDVLGQAIALGLYMDFYFLRTRKSGLVFKVGTGLVYNTNPYDKVKNNKNVVVSTALAILLQPRLGYYFKINDQVKLTTALTITHFSNGAIKVPNKGINLLTFNLGVAYTFTKEEMAYHKQDTVPPFSKKLRYNLGLFSGVHQYTPQLEPEPFITFSFYIDKRLSYMSALQAGLDGFFDLALKTYIDHDINLENQTKPDFKRVALIVGHELFISKISILTQLGIYLYSPYKAESAVYQRYGLKYYFYKNLSASVAFKSHFAVAESIEFGLNIRI